MGDTSGKAQDTKSMLKNASLRLIAKQGYNRTKVADIVKEIGAKQGTFYWHFSSKLEMALELIQENRDKLLAAIEQGYRTEFATKKNMLERSEELVREILKFSHENKDFMLMYLTSRRGSDPTIDKALAETRKALHEALTNNISQAMKLGMLPSSHNANLKGIMLLRLLESAIGWLLFRHDLEEDDVSDVVSDDVIKELVHFEMFGLLGGDADS